MSNAKKGNTVKIKYTGKLDDGSVFDQSQEGQPLEFKLGEGMIIPELEQNVEGMTIGDSKTVHIVSENAYGPYQEQMKFKVPATEIPKDLKIEVGQFLQIDGGAEGTHMVKVLEIGEKEVELDGNHPLAGKNLTFEIELVAIA